MEKKIGFSDERLERNQRYQPIFDFLKEVLGVGEHEIQTTMASDDAWFTDVATVVTLPELFNLYQRGLASNMPTVSDENEGYPPLRERMKFQYCPECVETRVHPQPFRDPAGRWLCGACWFMEGEEVEMIESDAIFPRGAGHHP